jgi:hypothetical protein
MKRLWKGEMTRDDIVTLNTRVVGKNGVHLPAHDSNSDVTYACALNKERNAISAQIFKDHICSGLFPPMNSSELPPDHTIIVETDIQSSGTNATSNKTRVSPELRDRILYTCGDSDCETAQNKKIDPCLRLYPGVHVMCVDNSKLKSDNIGNGTLCRVRGLKLKRNAPPMQWKNWDGYKVQTVNAHYGLHYTGALS